MVQDFVHQQYVSVIDVLFNEHLQHFDVFLGQEESHQAGGRGVRVDNLPENPSDLVFQGREMSAVP